MERGTDSNVLAEQKYLWDVGVMFSHLCSLYIDYRNPMEDRHILKLTGYVGITSLLQGHEAESGPVVDVFSQHI